MLESATALKKPKLDLAIAADVEGRCLGRRMQVGEGLPEIICPVKETARVAHLDGPSLSAAITAAALLDWPEAETQVADLAVSL